MVTNLGMERVGLTDFEIAEFWSMSAWTQYGQVRKSGGMAGFMESQGKSV